MKIYSPSKEERAFLYQEAHALEPLMKDLGSLTVVVEEISTKGVQKKRRPHFRVTFVVAPESVGMRVQATDSSLYEAAIAAKTEAERQLNALVNALPRQALESEEGSGIPPEFLH